MSKQRQKGTAFETALVRWLQAKTGDDRIHRKALHGSRDEGDIGGVFAHGLEGVIEAKNHKHVSKALIARWREQTLAERDNADASFGVLGVHRPGTGAHPTSPTFGDNVAQLSFRDLLRLMGMPDAPDLDERWLSIDLDTLAWLLAEGPRG